MKIILSGGGTIGSVTPLLAIAEKLPQEDFLFIGTKFGPEKDLVISREIRFQAISSGKFRRYFSFNNFIDLIKIKIAFWQSIFLLIKEKPQVIISAGGFVSVPLIWAGWVLRIPGIIHSQDIKTGLAIKLMKPFARITTKAFSDTKLNAKVIGNPVRSLQVKTNILNFQNKKPIILITGGGIGALALNKLVSKELCDIANVIHITGQEKNINNIKHPDYRAYEFLKQEMIEAMTIADIVVTRAGLATITELAVLGKPIIIIPIPHSHQEDNASYFANHQAAIYLKQNNLTPEKLDFEIKKLLADQHKMQMLARNIKKINKPHAAETLAKIVQSLQ